jgi:hypothetical protein
MNKLILYQSRKKMIGYSILFALFGVGTFLAAVDGQSEAFIGSIICWIGFVAMIVKSSNTEPQLIIDEIGIKDNRKQRFIAWEDVSEIWVRHTYRSHYALCMNFKNSEKYQQQMSSAERTFWKPDEWMGHGHMNLSFVGLTKSTDDVWYHIQRLKDLGYISASLR